MAKKLCKSDKNKMICGVCGGIAEYFNMDATLVRIVAALLGLFSIGTVVIVYIVIALIMPKADGQSYDAEDVDNLKRANVDPEEKKSSDNNGEKGRSDDEFFSHFN